MLQITTTGKFTHTDQFLSHMSKGDIFKTLDVFGRRGAEALKSATPSDTGETAASWNYEIVRNGRDVTIWWTNNHLDSTGTPIAIMLQYGHGTGTGGYVKGRDYINPAIQPIFDEIAASVWREVQAS